MKFKLLAFLMLVIVGTGLSQDVIDKVAAVVDNEVILKSEVDYQTKLFAAQRKLDPNTPGLEKQVLNNMINEKLAYAQAQLDSIQVTDEEISNSIESRIQYFIQQYGSKEKVEQIYGMSIEKIKRTLHDDVKKQLMVQKLQQKEFGGVEASRKDVEDFFDKFKDSLGVIPEKVDVAHIFRTPTISDKAKEEFKQRAENLLDSLKNGADFATLAKKYSEDPGSAKNGGDLGWASRGDFYPQFEAAAFALNPGQISGVIETPVGYHIIKLIEKRGEKIHARHILIKFKTDENSDLNTISFLSDVRDSIVKGVNSFAYYAKKYSEDKESAAFGGDLGTFYLNQLDNNMKEVVSKLKEGEISYPKRIDYGRSYGYHIVDLKKRIPQHQVNLKEDYQELKKLADEYKRQNLYNEWVEKLKDKIYWKILL